MIFITVGTIHLPFPRLIDTALNYFSDSQEEVIIQTGNYQKGMNPTENIKLAQMIGFNQLEKYLKQAQFIICSGGEGTLIQILNLAEKQPIIFPRMSLYKEHVNDQQVSIALNLKKQNLAKVALNKKELKKILDQRKNIKRNLYSQNFNNRKELIKNLSRYKGFFN